MPVVYVDYPGETSLKQIYGTFNRAMLRMIPNLRAYADPLTNAMVEFYLLSQVLHPPPTHTHTQTHTVVESVPRFRLFIPSRFYNLLLVSEGLFVAPSYPPPFPKQE